MERAEAPVELEWTAWPARRQPGRAVLVLLLIAAVAGWGWWLLRSPAAAPATALVLLSAVGEFLLPTRYRLSASGAEARGPGCWRRIAWREVKRVTVGEQGIKLSPLPPRGHLGGRAEAFRGVRLRCGPRREAVLALVRRFCPEALSAAEAPHAVDAPPPS